jgi:DNA-directed RNA polymerase subunit RPC12/RpoP
MARRRSIDLTDYRSVPRGEDIAVGAYADAQRRRRVLVAIAGLGLIGVSVWLYLVLRPHEEQGLAGTHPVPVKCVVEGCGYVGVVHLPAGRETFPVKCPKCSQRSCYKLWECRDCGYQFLPKGGAAELECPHCGSRRVGTADLPVEGGRGQSSSVGPPWPTWQLPHPDSARKRFADADDDVLGLALVARIDGAGRGS